jgi:membrane protein
MICVITELPDKSCDMRHPDTPGKTGSWRIAYEAIRRYIRHNMSVYAAALVFHVLLSIFPLILLLMALASFLNLADLSGWNRLAAPAFFPPRIVDLLVTATHELRPLRGGMLSFGAAAALWLASRATRATMQALNVAYEVETPPSARKRYPLSILYTLGIIALLMVAAVLMASGPTILQWMARLFGLEQIYVRLWTWLRWPAALTLLALCVAIVYYAAPNVRHEFRLVTAGSFLCVTVWSIASAGLRFYMTNIALYHKTYGGVGAIILLLLYLYISTTALLLGAELNALMEARHREGACSGEI